MNDDDHDLATFFEASPDMLCIRDDQFTFVRVNKAWETVLGHAPQDLIGQSMLAFIHPDDRPSSLVQMERLSREHEVSNFVDRYRHRDGHYRSLEWRARRVGDLVFGVARDITERLAIDAGLEEAKRAAEAANQAKTDFMANMSHEIRTPLNGVIGVVDALARTDLTPAQREMLALIKTSGVTLERLVSDILDVSKIEAGKLEIELGVFDLRDAVDPLIDLSQLRAQEKGLTFQVSLGETARGEFRGDVMRISQVISNLLSNAIKFTCTGEVSLKIEVIEAVAPGQPAQVVFEVEDSGVGFDAAFGAALFERFSQADPTVTRRFGGTGLGLSISRSLVEMMGGEIFAESHVGRGSLFRVVLPLVRDRSLADYDAACAGLTLGACTADQHAFFADAPLRVLLAEDHPINQRVIQLILAPYVAEITVVEDGAQALTAFGGNDYDLVLMDMQMPIMDGLAATAAIRAFETRVGRPRTPLIMLSANAMPQHRQDAQEAGADLHVAKPITASSLLEAISKVLEPAGVAANDEAPLVEDLELAANDEDASIEGFEPAANDLDIVADAVEPVAGDFEIEDAAITQAETA
jgi:PAS domain S-box-containing protein